MGQEEPAQHREALVKFRGAQARDVTIGNVAGRDMVQISIENLLLGEGLPTERPRPARYQLGAPVGDFTGREEQLARLRGALADAAHGSVVAIYGMGGSGKTQLALMAASAARHLYPEAQILIQLQGTSNEPTTSQQALAHVVRSFGYHPPVDLASLHQAYIDLLSKHRTLVLADDAADLAQVSLLLPPPGSALIVTSRQSFALPVRWEEQLSSLAELHACTLLRGICRRISEAEARQLAAYCGYLPLALRVAGSLLKHDETLDVERYLHGMREERARLLRLKDHTAPALDVEASLALSYNKLPPAAQWTFVRLGVFPGSFDWQTARGVLCADEDVASVREALRLLSRWNFVERDSAAAGRVRLHDLLRAFARQRLAASQRQHAVEHDFVLHFIETAETGEELQTGEMLQQWAIRERESLTAIREWLWCQPRSSAIDALLVREAEALGPITGLGEAPETSERQLTEAIAAATRLSRWNAVGSLLFLQGRVRLSHGRREGVTELWEEALAQVRRAAEPEGEARILAHLSGLYSIAGEDEQARLLAEQAVRLATAEGDQQARALGLKTLSVIHVNAGEHEAALGQLTRLADDARAAGDIAGACKALLDLCLVYQKTGRFENSIRTAIQVSKEAPAEHRDVLRVKALVAGARGAAMLFLPKQTEEWLDEALAIARTGSAAARGQVCSVLFLRSLCRWGRGELLLAAKDLQAAMQEPTGDDEIWLPDDELQKMLAVLDMPPPLVWFKEWEQKLRYSMQSELYHSRAKHARNSSSR